MKLGIAATLNCYGQREKWPDVRDTRQMLNFELNGLAGRLNGDKFCPEILGVQFQ